MTPHYALRNVFAILVLLALTLPTAAALQASEPVLVRVNSFNPTTRVYNFSCVLPPGAGPDRTWSIRPDTSIAATEYHSTQDTTLVTVDKDVMYHISCGALNQTGYVMTDFHIDRRIAFNTSRPYITVDQTSGTAFRARCNLPANVTQYSLNWVLNSHGGTQTLPQFNNQLEISASVPRPAQWEVTCAVWDIHRSQYLRGGLSIEFFSTGPAYIPTVDGCIPGDQCPYVDSPARPLAWVGPWPHNGTNQSGNQSNATQNVTIAVAAPGGSTVDIAEPANQTFTISIGNPGSLPVTVTWRLDAVNQTASFNQFSYTFHGNHSTAGAHDVLVTVQSPQNAVTRLWTLNVADTPQGNSSGNQTNTSVCYLSVQNIPAVCTGGAITVDTWSGGRAITCAQGGNSLSIVAWNKLDGTFEMYRQSTSGITPRICLGTTCVQNNGFAKSPPFPICVNGTGNGTNQTGNGTGNQTGNGTGNQTGNQTGISVTLNHAPWFPQGRNTILVCNASGFTPTSYDFIFGDGSQNLNYGQNNAWHTYATAGSYATICVARDPNRSVNATLSFILA